MNRQTEREALMERVYEALCPNKLWAEISNAFSADAQEITLLWKAREEPLAQAQLYMLECNRLERERDAAWAELDRLKHSSSIKKIIGFGPEYRPCEHETGEWRDEDGVCVEFTDGSRDCIYISCLYLAAGAQQVAVPQERCTCGQGQACRICDPDFSECRVSPETLKEEIVATCDEQDVNLAQGECLIHAVEAHHGIKGKE